MARNNDTACLKRNIDKLLAFWTDEPQVFSSMHKAQYSAHPRLMRLIIPASTLHEHGNESKYVLNVSHSHELTRRSSSFEESVVNGKFKVVAAALPAFLYETFDPDHAMDTCLRGPLLVRESSFFFFFRTFDIN